MPNPSPAVGRRRRSVLLFALLLLAACRGAGGGGAEGPAPAAAVRAVATLPPLAWLVDRVGGERVDTAVLLPPGTSPHLFEPSPRQLRTLEAADLLVVVGHPDLTFESHQVERLTGDRPELTVVSMAAASGTGGPDPHLWTAPSAMAATAGAVAAALESLDPAGADLYRRNLAVLEGELDALDGELRRTFAGLARRTFYVEHPAWGALAASYGLHQVALEEGGKETGARELVQRVEEARRSGVTAVFVQRGEPRQAARVFAAETGARLVELDPLAYDWPAETRRTAEALRSALTDPATP